MKISILGVLSNVQMLVLTALSGTQVGRDAEGNKYYKAKPRKGTARERRWVIYKNVMEASHVPPEWHGWLHHQTDQIPPAHSAHRKSWIKPHQPNKTGTPNAYAPKRARATGDYQAWAPPQ